jgi:8-oxo-dGTP pyrophosphatase MutT (NUDIX family)
MKLDVAGLRERLRRSPPAFTVYGDDGTGREAAALTAAAVLVPIVRREPELTVIFTQRTTHLKAHSGQVSFPAGRAEPHDPTPEFTALREAQEEIGLPMERVEVLARMPDYLTRTGFRVTPVVGLLEPPFELIPDPREVQEGTFTITNPGVFGSLIGTPIINQPQVGILCIGAIEKRPKVLTGADGEDVIAVRTCAYLSLSFDHRIVDGADADKFMAFVKKTLETFPEAVL